MYVFFLSFIALSLLLPILSNSVSPSLTLYLVQFEAIPRYIQRERERGGEIGRE